MLATVRRWPGELTGSLQVYGLPSAVEAPPIHSELQQNPRPTPAGGQGAWGERRDRGPDGDRQRRRRRARPLGVRHLDPLQVGAAVAGAGPVALRSGQRWRASSASVPTVFQFLVLAATLSFRSRKALFSLVLP
jgi:hypothetical protein